MGQFSLRKDQRLHGRKIIQELFTKGSSFYLHPFKVVFLSSPDEALRPRVLFSVPSKNFKKAVDRNKIKRRCREGYRLNKQLLATDKNWLIAYIYLAKEVLPSSSLHQKIRDSLVTLNRK